MGEDDKGSVAKLIEESGAVYSVLVVDNVPAVRERVLNHLVENGISAVQAADADVALKEIETRQIDVVLLDYDVRPIGGIECLKEIKIKRPDIQVIMTIGLGEIEEATSSLESGAFGYLIKPLKVEIVLQKVNRAVNYMEAIRQNNGNLSGMAIEVKERTTEAQLLNEAFKQSFLDSVRILVGLMEMHDHFTGGHSKRVSYYSTEIGAKMRLSKRELFHLEIAALLHDIEVIGISKRLQTAPFDDLNDKEQELVRQRTVFAQSILSPYDGYKRAGKIIRHHLEHIDGSGFPDGLKEKEIPLSSRILCVANAYDELKMRRLFTKEAVSTGRARSEFALNKIKKLAGKHFQSNLITALEEVITDLEKGKKKKIRIDIDELKPGMTLAANVLTNEGKSLMPKRKLLNLENIAKIKSFHKAGLIENIIMIYKA